MGFGLDGSACRCLAPRNIVSLFLHKKAPPGLDFAEEGEMKERGWS